MTQEQAQASASALERRIDMTVAMPDIERETEQRLKRMSKTVKMAGFRPGKVPFKLVAQTYGAQARSEAIGAAVEKTFNDKVREQNLRVAGYPRIEPKAGAGENEMAFLAVFEVYPDVVVGDISTRELKKPVLAVTEAEVDKTIDALRKQRTRYVPADRPAQKDDKVTIDFTGRKGGEVFDGGTGTDFPVLLGAGRMLPDFEAGLEGMAAGQTKTFDVKFPEEYQVSELAGQTAQFEVTCKAVEGPQLPEVDADFARMLGITDGDVAKMRDEVKANLNREVTKRLQSRVKAQVMDALVDVHPIDVPKALVEMEAQQMAEAALQDLRNRGMLAKDIPVQPSWFMDQASRRVKLGLIIAEVVKAKELHAKPEHVRAVVDDFAQTFEDPQEVVRWYYSQPQRLAEAEALAVENNVVNWALATAKVVEETVDFDELMGNGA